MPVCASKVLVIGIDAANPVLLHRWAQEGVLPNVNTLLQRGLVGATRSVDGFFIGATWPSFYTGVTPARHGCHYLHQLRRGTYEMYPVADHGVARHEAFWTRLSGAGRRVAVLDVPLSRIDPSLNGIQTVEWGSHDAVYGFCAWPPGIAGTIGSRFGSHPMAERSCDEVASTSNYEWFIRSLIEGARAKGDLTKHFLQQGNWDFFVQVFTEAHCVGHQCWHLHATNHPAHDAAAAARIGDPLRRVYVGIDRAIGEILDVAGDALVIVLVAHGMSHWYGANFMLNDFLYRLGVAQPRDHATHVRSTVRGYATRVWRSLPDGVRARVARLRASRSSRVPAIGVDTKTSLCFPQKNGQPVSGIRLNLMGREPLGQLTLASADAFCAELEHDLQQIVDEQTGRPLVARVRRTRDLYAGEFLEELPDLLVEWSDEIVVGSAKVGRGAAATVRAWSPKLGIVQGVNRYGRTGEHRPGGMFIAAGPGVHPADLNRQISILDFAPTFAALLDVQWKGGDGQPIGELLRSYKMASASRRPVSTTEP